MNSKRQHIAYLDYLRILAAVSVVYMHTAASGLRIGTPTRGWHLLNLGTSLAFTAVPLFFMISGYLLLSDAQTLHPAALRRRLPRLVVPLAAWSTAAALWNCHELGSYATLPTQLSDALHAPILTPYWFMYFLIFIYVLSPLLYGAVHTLERDGVRYLLGLIAVLSFFAMIRAFIPDQWDRYASMELLAHLQTAGSYVYEFLLGYFLGSLDRKISNKILAAAALGTYLVIVLGTWWLHIRDGGYSTAFQDQSAGFEVLLASCLFLLAKQNGNHAADWLRRTGIVPLLMPIYLMHALQLKIFYYHEVRLTRFPSVVGFTLLNLVLSYLITRTLASVKPLCYLFTGIPYETACRTCNWQSAFRNGRARRC